MCILSCKLLLSTVIMCTKEEIHKTVPITRTICALLNHWSLVVKTKVQSNVPSVEALVTTLPHLMRSKHVCFCSYYDFSLMSYRLCVYCVVICIHTSTSVVFLGAYQNTKLYDCHIHFISVFSSNLKLSSSIFTDHEGSAEDSEDISSAIVSYETKLKCSLNRRSQLLIF